MVAVGCAVIAQTLGQGQAKPRLALALIFGLIAAYIAILLALQSRDLGHAEAGALPGVPVPEEIDNPATLDDSVLWAAMAVQPIDTTALRARSAMWAPARRSLHLGMAVCLLIFLSVPPIYLFDTYVPLMVGFPLIAALAIYGSIRAVMAGGEVAQGFEAASQALAPLGLAVTGRPQVRMRTRAPVQAGYSAGLDGPVVITGERHGRRVTVTHPPLEGLKPVSRTELTVAVPQFAMKSRDGRVVATGEAPKAAVDALAAVKASMRWNGITGTAGEEGIAIERKGDTGYDWLLDLWLAERLADALGA